MAEDQSTVDREGVDLDAPLTVQGGYQESADHRPNPFYQYGNLDTTDLGGSHPSEQMTQISPVFAEARAQNLVTAARALDPDDPTPSELVVLPQSTVTVQGADRTAEDAKAELLGTVKRLQDEPVVVGGVSAAAAQAALGTAPEDADADLTDAEREADSAREEFKSDAQKAEDDRLAALRDRETTTATPDSSGGSSAPVAGTSPTPSANPPKEDAAKSSTSATARKTGSSTTAKSTSK